MNARRYLTGTASRTALIAGLALAAPLCGGPRAQDAVVLPEVNVVATAEEELKQAPGVSAPAR